MADNVKRCQFCSYSTVNISHLHDHVMAVHFEISPEFRCDLCEYKTSRGHAVLNRHKERKHGGCKSSMEKHRKSVHVKKCESGSGACDNESDKIPVVIGLKRESYYRSGVEHHKKEAHENRKKYYDCDRCGYKSTRKHSLERHKKAVHREANISISLAPKHVLLKQTGHNIDDSNLPADVLSSKCKEKFRKESKEFHNKISGLSQRNTMKGGDQDALLKPEQIEVTPALQEETNDNSQKHKCDNCSYVSYSEDDLHSHNRSAHDSIKAYECNQCEFKSTLRFEVNRHQWKAHGNVLATASYNLWAKQHRKKVGQENPDKHIHDINKQLRTHWKALPEADMKKFVEEAKMSSQVRRNGLMKEGLKEKDSVNNEVELKKKLPTGGPITVYSEAAKEIFSTSVKSVPKIGNKTNSMAACEAGVIKPMETNSQSKKVAVRNNRFIKEERKEEEEYIKSVGSFDQENMETDQNPTFHENIKSRTTQRGDMNKNSQRDISRKSNKEIKAPKDKEEEEKCDDCRGVNDQNVRLILDLAAAEERLEAERRLRQELENKLAQGRKHRFKREPVEPPENPVSILGI